MSLGGAWPTLSAAAAGTRGVQSARLSEFHMEFPGEERRETSGATNGACKTPVGLSRRLFVGRGSGPAGVDMVGSARRSESRDWVSDLLSGVGRGVLVCR